MEVKLKIYRIAILVLIVISMNRTITPEITVFTENGDIDLGLYARSIVIHKGVNQFVGTMALTFDPVLDGKGTTTTNVHTVNYWSKVIKKHSIVAAKINKREKRYKFLGFVVTKPQLYSADGSSTGQQLKVNCSMLLAEALLRDKIVTAPQLATIPEIINDENFSKRIEFFKNIRGEDVNGNVFLNGDPKNAIKWILENAVAMNAKIVSYNGKNYSTKSFIGKWDEKDYNGNNIYDVNILRNDKLMDRSLQTYSGTLNKYIDECIDKHFYEFFIDSTTSEAGLPICNITIRPKPFTYEELDSEPNEGWLHWEDLERYRVQIDSKFRHSLNETTLEIKNFFTINNENFLGGGTRSIPSKYGWNFPVFNKEGALKYGVRDLHLKSKLLNYDKEAEEYNSTENNESVEKICERTGKIKRMLNKRDRAVEWHSFPHYLSGQITWPGSDFTPGRILEIENMPYVYEEDGKTYTGVEFYIQEEITEYSYPNFYKTTLGLTRGSPRGLAAKYLKEKMPNFVRVNNFKEEVQPASESEEIKKTRDERTDVDKMKQYLG